MSNEAEVLVPTPRVYKTVSGAEKTLPPMTWGKEIRILRVVKDILKETIGSGVFKPTVDAEGNIVMEDDSTAVSQMLVLLFETAPDRITEAASAITGETGKWVEENLISETILEILVPFLKSKQDSILETLKPYLAQAVAASQ